MAQITFLQWSRGYKTFFMNIIMLINVKMPTIVGILKFNSMINTTSEFLKAIKVVFFSFYEQLKFFAQLS